MASHRFQFQAEEGEPFLVVVCSEERELDFRIRHGELLVAVFACDYVGFEVTQVALFPCSFQRESNAATPLAGDPS